MSSNHRLVDRDRDLFTDSRLSNILSLVLYPDDLPDPQGRMVVFSCGSGMRSVKAIEIAQAAGRQFNAHLAGGLKAWKAAGLPTES